MKKTKTKTKNNMIQTGIGSAQTWTTTSNIPTKEDIIERLLELRQITFREALTLLGYPCVYSIQPYSYGTGVTDYASNIPSTLTSK